jgi:MoaA/NifB/PqqE/SkfB family radical SAM enzyme
LDLNFFKNLLTPELLRDQVQRITMCGDIGDPIYASEYLEIIDYIKTHNDRIHVYTITNGSYRKTEWWREFAKISNQYDTVNFSIDGYDNHSNNLYRVGSDWDSIMQGMNIMCQESSAFVYWATILFQFNQDHLDRIKQQARHAGCDGLQLTYSTKFGSKYGNAYGGADDLLEPRAENISSTHRYERETHNLSGRQINNHEYLEHNKQKYLEIKQQYHNQPVTPLCEIGNRGIYVNAEGVVFPCSWTSFPYTSLTHQDKTIRWPDSFFAKYRQQMNLHNRTFEEITQDPLWNMCSTGFTNPAKTWVECSQKCSTNLVTENYAVGWETN